MYNFSIVLDDPPAPAERDELGLETCDVPARRLKTNQKVKNVVRRKPKVTRTGFGRREVWRRHLMRSAKGWSAWCQSRTGNALMREIGKGGILILIAYHDCWVGGVRGVGLGRVSCRAGPRIVQDTTD